MSANHPHLSVASCIASSLLCCGLGAPTPGHAAPLALSQAPALATAGNPSCRDDDNTVASWVLSDNRLYADLKAFEGGYRLRRFAGTLLAYAGMGETGSLSSTPVWDAAAQLDARPLDSRFLLSSSGTGAAATGLLWNRLALLPLVQQEPLNRNSRGSVDAKGQDRLDYLRGERSKEVARGGAFRDRDSRLGDIVHSRLWYTGRPASGYSAQNYAAFRSTQAINGGKGLRTPMLYVGANDGMLHGFSANDGRELLAYIPQGVAQGEMRRLSDTDYAHQYFVDGSPYTGDALIGPPGLTPWRTVLTGTLGAGGTGYFVLDVTDPADFTADNAEKLVLVDTTASTDADLGNITAEPVVDDTAAHKSAQIVMLNNGRWATVMGNGYNSANEAPVLLIQYLDGARELFKLSPCGIPVSTSCASAQGGNGLSAPRLIDLNGDGTVDIAYAGDLRGNLWKFDLSAANEAAWKLAFNNRPFFIARHQGDIQPITSAPYTARHPLNGIMVVVATGRNLTDADPTDATTQSVYGLWDDSAIVSSARLVSVANGIPLNTEAAPALPASLVEQNVSATAEGPYYASSNHTVDYPKQRGWYLHWPIPKQRVLQNISHFAGEKILIRSVVPATSADISTQTCTASSAPGRSFLTVLNLFSGRRPEAPISSRPDANADWSTLETAAGDAGLLKHRNQVLLLLPRGVCPAGRNCVPALNAGTYRGTRASQRQIR